LNPKSFVDALADLRLPSVFNPYIDNCKVFDRADAASRRRRNLEKFLGAALAANVQTIWVARDLGYRGGRRTGIPLTDELHLDNVTQLFSGIALQRATKGPVVTERTAAIVWRVIASIDEPVMLWNVFPFHPHQPEHSFSNRCHTRVERETTFPLLQALIEMIQPKRLVAIGRDAQLALSELKTQVIGVRHPSYGGQSEFIAGVQALYGVSSAPKCKTPIQETMLPY
jgi:uracil-DNA glycosylase